MLWTSWINYSSRRIIFKTCHSRSKICFSLSFFDNIFFFLLKYFKTVLITEDTESLQLYSKIYYVFDELCHISEAIVDELIPTIEHRLTVKEWIEYRSLKITLFRFPMKNIVVMQRKSLLMSQVHRIMISLKDIKPYGIHFSISMSTKQTFSI